MTQWHTCCLRTNHRIRDSRYSDTEGDMYMFKKSGGICVCFFIAIIVCISSAAYAQSRTITGTVYSSYELVADDGKVFAVTADDKGDELVEMDGAMVSVTGVVDELDGEYAITVTGFKVLADDLQEQDPEEEPQEQDQEGEPQDNDIPADETKE